MKRRLLLTLDRLGLLLPAYRAYEGLRAFRGRGGAAPDGLPLPPARLRLMVAGVPEADWFLAGGRAAADSIRAAVPAPLESMRSILDFGCGCGRVVRWWRELPAEIHGSDFNPTLVRWCRENLPFGMYAVNGPEPPLELGDDSFDLVYALSVLTHLPVETQRRWLDELARVGREWVLVSIHGEPYRVRLKPEERSRFDAGEIVVRWGVVAGTNLCTAFHPPGSLERLAGERFEVVSYIPEGAKGNPPQDLVLLRVR
ncbi:MAG TPA: class I SAM-dependent methyltransferase [Gaiellaceae bacterium]|nr:class I SAM-dependent methyltransferase [Gaiellaceae bacterium]